MTPRRSFILDTVLDAVFRTALLFSLFLLFAGHNAPGGGFVGGLVASAAVVLRYVAGGIDEVERIVRVRGGTLLGGGLLLATAIGMAGWLWKGAFLGSAKIDVAVPVFTRLKATSALPFDIGVYLIVVGLVLTIVETLGASADRQADTRQVGR